MNKILFDQISLYCAEYFPANRLIDCITVHLNVTGRNYYDWQTTNFAGLRFSLPKHYFGCYFENCLAAAQQEQCQCGQQNGKSLGAELAEP